MKDHDTTGYNFVQWSRGAESADQILLSATARYNESVPLRV